MVARVPELLALAGLLPAPTAAFSMSYCRGAPLQRHIQLPAAACALQSLELVTSMACYAKQQACTSIQFGTNKMTTLGLRIIKSWSAEGFELTCSPSWWCVPPTQHLLCNIDVVCVKRFWVGCIMAAHLQALNSGPLAACAMHHLTLTLMARLAVHRMPRLGRGGAEGAVTALSNVLV